MEKLKLLFKNKKFVASVVGAVLAAASVYGVAIDPAVGDAVVNVVVAAFGG